MTKVYPTMKRLPSIKSVGRARKLFDVTITWSTEVFQMDGKKGEVVQRARKPFKAILTVLHVGIIIAVSSWAFAQERASLVP